MKMYYRIIILIAAILAISPLSFTQIPAPIITHKNKIRTLYTKITNNLILNGRYSEALYYIKKRNVKIDPNNTTIHEKNKLNKISLLAKAKANTNSAKISGNGTAEELQSPILSIPVSIDNKNLDDLLITNYETFYNNINQFCVINKLRNTTCDELGTSVLLNINNTNPHLYNNIFNNTHYKHNINPSNFGIKIALERTSTWKYNRLNLKKYKYFLYQPTGGYNNQRIELNRAIRCARDLKRGLIVPMVGSHALGWEGYSRLVEHELYEHDKITDFHYIQYTLMYNCGTLF